jgi:hypothetical protein
MLLINLPLGKIDNEPPQALLCNEPGEKVLTFSSARLGDTHSVSPNEPSSFESLDSKSRMLLINLPLGKIDNE